MLFTGTMLFYGLADDEFPFADLLALAPYHREGSRLRGIQRFTVNDVINIYKNKPLYRTGISVGDYPVEIEFILQQSEHFAR